MKIDMSKVSLRPWKFEHYHVSDAIFTPKTHKLKKVAHDVYNVYDANGDQLAWVDTHDYKATSLEGDDLAYAVHAVNLHGRLVEVLENNLNALEIAIGLLPENTDIRCARKEIQNIRDGLLSEAKGDSDEKLDS